MDTAILTQIDIRHFYEMTGAASATLLYRASRDGYHASAFHAKCDGRTRTVTVFKTNTNYVFGGYASAAWSSTGGYVDDTSAYLFGLRNGDVPIYKIYSKRAPSGYYVYYAIYANSSYGPTFGGYRYDSSTYYPVFDINTPTRPDVSSGSCTQNSYIAASNILAGSTTWSASDISSISTQLNGRIYQKTPIVDKRPQFIS